MNNGEKFYCPSTGAPWWTCIKNAFNCLVVDWSRNFFLTVPMEYKVLYFRYMYWCLAGAMPFASTSIWRVSVILLFGSIDASKHKWWSNINTGTTSWLSYYSPILRFVLSHVLLLACRLSWLVDAVVFSWQCNQLASDMFCHLVDSKFTAWKNVPTHPFQP